MGTLLRPEEIPEFCDLANEFRVSERKIVEELVKLHDKGDDIFLFNHLSPEARKFFSPMMAQLN